jgi:hypothetical protein
MPEPIVARLREQYLPWVCEAGQSRGPAPDRSGIVALSRLCPTRVQAKAHRRIRIERVCLLEPGRHSESVERPAENGNGAGWPGRRLQQMSVPWRDQLLKARGKMEVE